MIKYRLHWTKHPLKDQEWYENECLRFTEDEIARELDINYSLSVSGKVFAPFREDRHISTVQLLYNAQLPIYRIWDFGKTNCILYAQIDVYGRKKILHERLLGKQGIHTEKDAQDSNIQEQLKVCQNDSNNLFPDMSFVDICDPAGSYDDQRGATPEVDTLTAAGIYPQYHRIIALPTKDRKVRGRSLITKDLQSTPGGVEALSIFCGPNNDVGCPTLKRAFQGGYCYRKDANGNITDKIKEPNHPYEDVIDCLIYLFLETDGYTGTDVGDWEPTYSNDYVNPYTGY